MMRIVCSIMIIAIFAAPAGGATFQERILPVEAPVLQSFLQDLDRDGLLDFAFFAEDRRFVIFFQSADGRFQRSEAGFVMPQGTDSLDLADVDGDLVPDICLTVEGRRLQVICSANDPTFWAGLVDAGEVDGSGARQLDLGAVASLPLTDSLHRSPDLMWDLDGDGRQDLIYPRFQGLDVMFNRTGDQGAGTAPFASTREQFIPRGPRVSLRGHRIDVRREIPQAVDLNGDGGLELLFEPRPVRGLGQLECSWCRYDAGERALQQVRQELQFGVGESVTEYLLDDFNGDGEPDLALLSTAFNLDQGGGGEGTVSTGGGSFFEEKLLRLWLTPGPGERMARKPSGSWTSKVNLWQEAMIRHRDLTGDGVADLCVFYYKGLIKAKLVVDVYPGLGNGRYGEQKQVWKTDFKKADRRTILADHDLDGDGLEDLVLLADDGVHIFRGDPGGKDGPWRKKPWAVLPSKIGNRQGGKDDETVTFSIGSTGSDISFSSNQLEGLRIVDLDNDGRKDLVLANRPDNWHDNNSGQPPVTLLIHLAR